MSGKLKIMKKGLKTLLAIACLYSCTTQEQKAKGNETTSVAKVYTVVIQQMKFTPAELTVYGGDTVRWINHDIVDHNVTEEANKEWSSSTLSPGKSWNMVVKKSANYLCTIHPVMKGKLILKQ
jgi:plastocyanin